MGGAAQQEPDHQNTSHWLLESPEVQVQSVCRCVAGHHPPSPRAQSRKLEGHHEKAGLQLRSACRGVQHSKGGAPPGGRCRSTGRRPP